MNSVNLIGRLGRDVEIRTMQSGAQVATLSVALTTKWTSKDGEKRERVDWVRVISWIKTAAQAEFYQKVFRKGALVAVVGRLRYRQWEDKQGGKRDALEVEAAPQSGVKPLGSRPKSGDGAKQEQEQQERKSEYDDEIPF